MRLKEIVAEALFLEATHHKPSCPFPEEDSVIRDFYHRCAVEEIPKLLSAYFRMGKSGMYYRFLNGCITNFMHQHGNMLDKDTKQSLIKRIIRNLPQYTRHTSPT